MISFPFDFPMTGPSIMTSVYCLSMYSICLFEGYRLSKSWDVVTIRRLPFSSIFLFVGFVGFFFVTNCMNGDFFHTMEKVHNYYPSIYSYYNGEPIYRAITSFVNNNYLLFRIIVWGGGFAVFCVTARRMRIPLFMAVSILCIFYSVLFCYARATAAMAVYFFGLSFFCNPYKFRLLGYVIGGLLIFFSSSFHTSALIMIAMTFVLFLPIKKWTIIAFLFAIPIMALYFKDYFFLFALDEDTDEYMSNKLLNYSEREVVTGIASQTINLLRYASIYIPLFYCYKLFFNKKNKWYKYESDFLLFKVSFGLAYVSTSFLFFGDNFYTFFYRILNMTMIPISLLLSKLYMEKKMSRRHFLQCIFIGVISQFMHYSYMIYLNR